MSITSGFTAALADTVTIDQYFGQIQTGGSSTVSNVQTNPYQNIMSTYVLVSAAGDIIFENQQGDLQYMPGTPEGLFPISATKIVSAGLVRGIPRTTTATVSTWYAGYKY